MDEKESSAERTADKVCCCRCINWHAALLRAKNVMANPKGIWAAAKIEEETSSELFQQYVVPLTIISVAAAFIGFTFIGFEVPLIGTFRWPFFHGLVYTALSFLLQLVFIFVSAMIVEKLAPMFGASVRRIDALKLVAYSLTPVLIGSLVLIIPSLCWLIYLFMLYSVCLFFNGLPEMTGVGIANRTKYFVCSLAAVFAAKIFIFLIARSAVPVPPLPITGLHRGGPVNAQELRSTVDQLQKTLEQFEKSLPEQPK